MNNVDGIHEVIITDREGLIITSESRGFSGDESLLGGIAAIIDTYFERIKGEFSPETSFFNITIIGSQKFAYCSMGLKSILLSISDLTTSDNELRVYSEHIAGKIELLLEGNENISLEIPALLRVLAKSKDGKIPTGNFPIKLLLTGNYKVGKTSLINRFVENTFSESYQATIGIQIFQKNLNISENTKINIVIWDIGGQIVQMAPYRRRFFAGANSAFIVVDRTRINTLDSIKTWYNEIKKNVGKKIDIILVGNKSDIVDKLTISEKQIKEAAEQNGFSYILTSTKTGENVLDAFLFIAHKFLESV
ncbi:MAG: GTP-binding protein [Candidatus Lokiarchaeota archaeon]|nr:GTP-binding protein [Candidatus Lokiarchaeota archaeon]